MSELHPSVRFFLSLARVNAAMTRRFDAGLGGLGFSEFMILHHLSQVSGERMRRIDLAAKIGLTASGVTRLLGPMEKVGLIKRVNNEHDARVSEVLLAASGRRKMVEALEDAQDLAEECLGTAPRQTLEKFSAFLDELNPRA